MRLVFIRHGETDVNLVNLTHKTGDQVGLNDIGKGQITKATAVLKQNYVEKVYYSPELRTTQTAQIISTELNNPLVSLTELQERNWGDWEGMSWSEIRTRLDPMSLDERYTFIPPGGESWKQMENRIKKVLDLITQGPERSVCVVTHAGFLRGSIPIIKNEPKETSFKYDFANASITIYDYDGNGYKEAMFNDTSHLL